MVEVQSQAGFRAYWRMLRTHWRGLVVAFYLMLILCAVSLSLYVASLGPILAMSRSGYIRWLPDEIVRAYAFPGKVLSHVPGIGKLVDFYVDTWLERFNVRDATI